MRKLSVALLLCSLFSVGCIKRTIIGFADHPKHELTELEVMKTGFYVFYASAEHMFLSCTDDDKQLTCKRQCGGETDLQCPAATAAGVFSDVLYIASHLGAPAL